MAWLSIEGSGRCNHDYDASFAIGINWRGASHVRKDLTDEIDCTSDIDVHDEVKIFEGEGIEISVEDLKL